MYQSIYNHGRILKMKHTMLKTESDKIQIERVMYTQATYPCIHHTLSFVPQDWPHLVQHLRLKNRPIGYKYQVSAPLENQYTLFLNIEIEQA